MKARGRFHGDDFAPLVGFIASGPNVDRVRSTRYPRQRLNFLPDPHGQGSLRPTLA
jgi:hypothetical protein